MIYAVVGLLIGGTLGFLVPFGIPAGYSSLFSVALMACMDSVFGGIKAACSGTFDDKIFISGFFYVCHSTVNSNDLSPSCNGLSRFLLPPTTTATPYSFRSGKP